MTDAEKIQIAADIIRAHCPGTPQDVALHAARKLHTAWRDNFEPRAMKPGEISQRFRERYEGEAP